MIEESFILQLNHLATLRLSNTYSGIVLLLFIHLVQLSLMLLTGRAPIHSCIINLHADDNFVALTGRLLDMLTVCSKRPFMFLLFKCVDGGKCSTIVQMNCELKASRKVKSWQHEFYLRSFYTLYTGYSNFKLVFIRGVFQLMQGVMLEIARRPRS